jgi:carbonic anhydrase
MYLGMSLLVVLGHEGCGAVKAALAAKFHRAKHPERIRQLVELIEPGLERIDPKLSAAEQLEAGVEANVRWSVHQVSRAREVRRAFREKGSVLIVGAIYELTTGKVRWLDQ